MLGAQTDVLVGLHAESVRDDAGRGDSKGRGAVLLVNNWTNALWISFSEVVAGFQDGVLIHCRASLQRLLVGEEVGEDFLGIGEGLVLEEGIGTKLVSVVSVVVGVDFVGLDDWSEAQLLGFTKESGQEGDGNDEDEASDDDVVAVLVPDGVLLSFLKTLSGSLDGGIGLLDVLRVLGDSSSGGG